MDFALRELWWVGILPCVTAAVAMLTCRGLKLRPAVAWAASFSLGFVVGHVGLIARHYPAAVPDLLLRPHTARDWLPALLLIAVGIAALSAYAPRSWQRWIFSLACVFAIVIPMRLLAYSIYAVSLWPGAEKPAIVLAFAAAFIALWSTLALGRANGEPRLRGLLLVAVAVGIAVTVTIGGSFTYGELAGAAAASLTGALIGERCFSTRALQNPSTPDPTGFHGVAGPLAVALGGLIFVGYFYADLPASSAVLLTVALAAAGGRLPTQWPATPRTRSLFRAALTLLPLFLALYLAWSAMPVNPYAN